MKKLKLYFDYAKSKLKQRKKKEVKTIDTEEEKFEIWQADFSDKENARFPEHEMSGQRAFFEERDGARSFVLELKRKSLYAWAMNPMYRYHNFVLESEIEFDTAGKAESSKNEKSGSVNIDSKAGTCAAGFLFRHIGERAFYALLVSDKGWVRLDAVVNNTPMPVIGWTKPLAETETQKYKIKLICAGTSITILVNNVWLGKFDSDIVQSPGKIAFAGQNWESYSSVKFYLNSFKIISKPMLVEEADSAANDEGGISPEAYVNLANTYYGMGQGVAAIYQLKQAWKLREPVLQDKILAGKIYKSQNLFEEAENEFSEALEMDSENFEIQIELASLYYQSDKLKDLKKLFKDIPAKKFKESGLLSTLKAHLLSSEGKHDKAAKLYKQAFDLSPQSGILKYNEAKELILSEEKDAGVQAYIDAGNMFLSAEEYKELADVINALEVLEGENPELLALRAKFYYAIENKTEALLNLKKLIKTKTKDASIWYLYGMLVKDEDMPEAIKAFKKAQKLEPEYALYAFRLADALYMNDDDCSEALKKAEDLDPENGWIYNLKGLCAMDEDNFELAEKEIQKARELLPAELTILENYLEAKRMQGKLKDCEALFDVENGTADLAVERSRAEGFHIFANALFFDEEYDEADVWYQKALKLKPFSPEILTDKAENSLEIGFLNDADTLLVKALDIEPSERIYRLLSLVAMKKGDYARTEVIIKQAIEEFGGTEELLFDLAQFYIQTSKFDNAKKVLKELKDCEDKELLKELKESLKAKTK